MEEINTKVAELTVLYKLFNEKSNKQTSISLRKALMKLKNTSHSLRKNVLLSMKPKLPPEATTKSVAPEAPVAVAVIVCPTL